MLLLVLSDTESTSALKTRLVVLVQHSVMFAQHMIPAPSAKREPTCKKESASRIAKSDGQLIQPTPSANHAWT